MRSGGPHVTEPPSPPAPATRGWRALQHWASVGSVDAREPRASASPACRPVHTGWQPQLPKTRVLAHPTLAKRPSSAARPALMDALTAGELHLPLPAQLPCPTSHLLLLGPLPGDPNDGQLQNSPPGLPHSPGHRGPAPRPPPCPVHKRAEELTHTRVERAENWIAEQVSSGDTSLVTKKSPLSQRHSVSEQRRTQAPSCLGRHDPAALPAPSSFKAHSGTVT